MEKYILTKSEIKSHIDFLKRDIAQRKMDGNTEGITPETSKVTIQKHNEEGVKTHESIFTLAELEKMLNEPTN